MLSPVVGPASGGLTNKTGRIDVAQPFQITAGFAARTLSAPTLNAFDVSAALAGGALKMNVPVSKGTRPAHGEDERGAHPWVLGTIRTVAVLRSRDSYTPV